jgi:5'-3' exonuclease
MSWRKGIYPEYKSKRKKPSDIDWAFVYSTYGEFKSRLREKNVRLLESESIEGDDWVSYIVSESNRRGLSNLIVSNDYDIKQLLTYSLDPPYINFMTNEMSNRQKFFFPKNHQLFLDRVKEGQSQDIFDLNDDGEFLGYIRSVKEKFASFEIDPVGSMLAKVISGDVSDNIRSVWSTKSKSGKSIGIGERGAEKILARYRQEFGEPLPGDPDLCDNIADIICEAKRLSKSDLPGISGRVRDNLALINLDCGSMPREIQRTIADGYQSI